LDTKYKSQKTRELSPPEKKNKTAFFQPGGIKGKKEKKGEKTQKGKKSPGEKNS